jgi:hypothetical protein
MGKSKNFSHESFERKEELVVGSDKKFGLIFSAIFFLLGVSSLIIAFYFRLVLFALSFSFLAAALINPSALHPINKLWMKFGLLLNKIVSPVILAFLFFVVFTPMGLLLKIFRKDILKLRLDKNIKSYWIDSTQALPTSMKDQF